MTGVIETVEGLLNGTYRVSLLTRSEPHLAALQGKEVDIILKEKKARRSLDANAYYWVLLGQLAEKLKNSKAAVHNIMLRRYGQDFVVEGRLVYVVIPETEDAAKQVEESETVHLRPTSQVKEGKDGRMWRTYIMRRGSHDYNTAEMAHLIDGLVSECKEAGIETLPPDELRRMYEQAQ